GEAPGLQADGRRTHRLSLLTALELAPDDLHVFLAFVVDDKEHLGPVLGRLGLQEPVEFWPGHRLAGRLPAPKTLSSFSKTNPAMAFVRLALAPFTVSRTSTARPSFTSWSLSTSVGWVRP